MSGADPHDRLADLLGDMKRLACEHRALLATAKPDIAAIGKARWRLAGASRDRMQLLMATVFPLLDVRCEAAELKVVRALRDGTTAYRGEVSRYLSRWSPASIAAEWDLYREEALAFRQMVASRLSAERCILLPPLARIAMTDASTASDRTEARPTRSAG